MTGQSVAYRLMSAILTCAVLASSSCGGPEQDPVGEASEPPSSLYVITYANFFVGALRAGGSNAGAFEISRRPEADGLYHLKIELMEAEKVKPLEMHYEGQDAGLGPVYARFGVEEVIPGRGRLAKKLIACHQVADRRARDEAGDEFAELPSASLLVDFSAGGPDGKVWRRYVRITDLQVGKVTFDGFDLRFERDESIRLSSGTSRNLMRLGTGSEEQVRRLAQVTDWQSENLTELVKAVGIKIDPDSNADYWAPLDGVQIPVGTVFAVRAPTGSSPAALMYVRESQRDLARLLVLHAPGAYRPEKPK
jgi:hypothetical protein